MNQFWYNKSGYLLEMDPRFYSRKQCMHYVEKFYKASNYMGVYDAYLGSELNFIGRLENMNNDFCTLQSLLDIKNPNDYALPSRLNEPKATHNMKPRNDNKGLKILKKLFKDDIAKFQAYC